MNDISNKCLMCHWYCDEVLEECQGEEEPCHEFVLAREYKIMEKNLMSDDLISRKDAIETVKTIIQAGLPEEAIYAGLKEIPASYNADAAKKKPESEYEDAKEIYEEYDEEQYYGEMIAYKHAIEILENGGIK